MPMQWASFTVETRGPGSVSLPSWCGRFRVDGPGSEYTKCPPFKGSMGGQPRATLVARIATTSNSLDEGRPLP